MSRSSRRDDFVVIIPTYDRAHTLARALDSLVAQTDPHWQCWVLVDGSSNWSTDQTVPLVEEYRAQDNRIDLLVFPENRGGVAMNKMGMELACATGVYWTRLGSDDWFLPRKLELDRIALAHADACYGSYHHGGVFRGPWRDSAEWSDELNIPQDARAALLRGEFAVSWANIALRTDVLERVRSAFGTFVDRRLRNMEDYLFNTRAARFTEFAWRALSADHQHVIVGATSPSQVPFPYEPDACYTIAASSASYGPASAWAARDAEMTVQCRADDHARGITPIALPAPRPLIMEV